MYSGAPLFSFGVQFNVGDFLRPVYAEDFPEITSLESVDCIVQFSGEGPQSAVLEENTCNICIESSDFDCVADFSALKNVFSVLKASIAGFFLRLISFSVSSRLPSNLHFFHFSLPCRIIS